MNDRFLRSESGRKKIRDNSSEDNFAQGMLDDSNKIMYAILSIEFRILRAVYLQISE